MLKDITLGQYFPIDSVVHRLDPRLKILSVILIIVVVFFCKTVSSFAVAITFNIALILLSKIKFSVVLKSLKPVMFLILFTSLLNIFLTGGTDYIIKWKFINITYTGIKSAVIMAIRIVLLVSFTSLLTFTTSPIRLTDGIECLLKPFSKIGLPSHELAMMMTIALRFIPTLLEETDKIIMAQKSRGADFESGNIIKRAKSLVPILVPLFINSFRRADELATAMECRCYRGGVGRTKLNELKYSAIDLYAAFVCITFSALIIILGVYGI